jgi:hypothetical protein
MTGLSSTIVELLLDQLTTAIQKCLKGTGDQRRIQAPTQAVSRKLYEIASR